MSKKKFKTERQKLLEENIYRIQDFEQPTGNPKRFTRITHYMLSHKKFKELSSSAKVLLLYMLDWAFANEEFIKSHNFDFSTTMLERERIMTKKTTITAMNELEKQGFIQKENNACREAGITQKWSFTNRWYSGEKRVF